MKEIYIKEEILSLLKMNKSLNVVEIITALQAKKVINSDDLDRIFVALEELTEANFISNPFVYYSYTGQKKLPSETKIYLLTNN